MNLNFIEMNIINFATYYNLKHLRWQQHQTTSNQMATVK